MELLIIIGLTLLNGIFSMSEMSLVSSRKFKLESARKKGSQGAKTALELAENPTRFLSTVQIGITLIGILLGVYSGENLTRGVEEFLSQYAFIKPYAHNIAVGTVVLFVTYLSIVLGELFPKRLGLTFPEPVAIFLSRPMKVLSIITSPFVWLLTSTNDLLVRLFGIKKTLDGKVSEEEIKSIIKESAEGGEIQEIEQDIVERVFELGDRKVNTLITHRSDIVYFNETDDLSAILEKVNHEKHSAYPVCRNHAIDHVTGIVLLKDLFSSLKEESFQLKDYMKQPLFVNESTYAYRLLEIFKKEKMHYGIVIDEYGTTQGIVTMDDVVDALVGDVTEQHQDEYALTQRDENSWLVDGQYPIIEFIKYFNISLDKNHKDRFVTIAGLFIDKLGHLPLVGDKIIIEDLQLEIIDKDGQRIDKILVTKIENEE
jgi:putative hemolysin